MISTNRNLDAIVAAAGGERNGGTRKIGTGETGGREIERGTAADIVGVSAAVMNKAIVLDHLGMMREAGTGVAQLLGRERALMLDLPVQVLLPALPLKEATPGYNIAYLTFLARAKRVLHIWAEKGDGSQVLCDLIPHALQQDGRHLFAIELCPASDPAVVWGEVSL